MKPSKKGGPQTFSCCSMTGVQKSKVLIEKNTNPCTNNLTIIKNPFENHQKPG